MNRGYEDRCHRNRRPETSLIDLGDITAARGSEMSSRLMFQLAELFGTFDVNISVHHA
ncbi:hypothetical protein [Flexivirga oryzae]|uniref:Uncharacterized protein n=1 Tax=Flexivirga oryzae TaxID=1794944 RepID=A0A839NBX5_9MICO|nr:hypothetical protein [Flexivirga oryzae]MBB2893753.1 hypothetical protein [Flexivirga oryzae]